MRLHRHPVAGHQIAFSRQVEVTGAGVGVSTIGHLHLKIASAFNRKVKAVARCRQRALRINTRGTVDLNARAKVGANGIFILRRRCRSGNSHRLIGQCFKARAIAFEANSIHVGQIVSDNLHPHILRIKARAGDVECSIRHQILSFLADWFIVKATSGRWSPYPCRVRR